MKRIALLFTLLCLGVNLSFGQQADNEQYRRSSLYSILIDHSKKEFNEEIKDVFLTIPIPDKYDNHDLSVKVIDSGEKKEAEQQISSFLERNAVARRMVAKWFNRDMETGFCDMNLIVERGLYDATFFDVELSKISQRGMAALSDAGEELINNTFVLVNDITYVDRNKAASAVGLGLRILGAGAAIATGNSDFMDVGNLAGDLSESIKGFGVKVTSYLYQLEWNDDIANTFYSQYYMNPSSADENKRLAFNENKDLFRLKYIGKQDVSSGNISIAGINLDTPEAMIRKVCTRAIDESIVELQKENEVFRVKTPIYSVEPTIIAKIGLKEGVHEKSKYEVLEKQVDEKGKTKYKRVGVIKPVKGKIWDNRYMAIEENAYGAQFEGTTFKKESGGNFYPGLLIREIN